MITRQSWGGSSRLDSLATQVYKALYMTKRIGDMALLKEKLKGFANIECISETGFAEEEWQASISA
jgi:hypothetical protein